MNRQQLQHDIDEQIRELKTRRNTYASISMLPEDLLVDIFLYLQSRVWKRIGEWHHISHVCRQWRYTALNAPILWTEPDPFCHEYTNAMLERSKTANLTMNLYQRNGVSTATILGHVERTQVLRLFFADLDRDQPEETSEAWGGFLSLRHRFPRLETLVAHKSHGTSAKLPPAFINQLLSLKHISLWNVSVDCQLLPVGLQSLDLQLGYQDDVPLQTLLPWLGHLIHLQQLSIKGISPELALNTHVINVCLPQLQKLVVQSERAGHGRSLILDLLPKLELPKLNSLNIHAHLDHDGGSLAWTAFELIVAIISNGNFQREASGALWVDDTFDAVLRLYQDGNRIIELYLAVPQPASHAFLLRRCTRLTSMFPRLEALSLCTLAFDSDNLIELFGDLPYLRTIIVGHSGLLVDLLSQVLQAATKKSCSCSASKSRCACARQSKFRALDTISCEHIFWPDEDVLNNFCNALLQRSKHAAKIKALYWRSDDPCNPSDAPPQWMVDALMEGGIWVEEGQVPGFYFDMDRL